MNQKLMILMLCFFGVVVSASPVEEVFLQANQEYKAHHYEKALELYSVIENKGSATWHNMGNCACYLKKPVDALVYWRKAQRECSFTEFDELQKNIDGIYGQLGKTPARSAWEQFVDKCIHRFSLLFFQLFFLVVWGLLFLVIWLNLRYKKGIVFILLPLNLMFGAAVVTKYRAQTCPCAMVVQEAATLFAGPDASYRALATVSLAQELRVVDRKGEWCKVRTQNLAGWILADTLKTL